MHRSKFGLARFGDLVKRLPSRGEDRHDVQSDRAAGCISHTPFQGRAVRCEARIGTTHRPHIRSSCRPLPSGPVCVLPRTEWCVKTLGQTAQAFREVRLSVSRLRLGGTTSAWREQHPPVRGGIRLCDHEEMIPDAIPEN